MNPYSSHRSSALTDSTRDRQTYQSFWPRFFATVLVPRLSGYKPFHSGGSVWDGSYQYIQCLRLSSRASDTIEAVLYLHGETLKVASIPPSSPREKLIAPGYSV